MIQNNQKQWQFLKKSVELDKTPHALLFYGGDISVQSALEFVKLLNCQEKIKERPCNKCRACSDIDKQVHPDLFIVEPQENKEIKISQIRDLHNRLGFRAYSAPFKAAVIVNAHCLNVQAQSAFLKLLEEPKGRTVFILITQYPEMLLPTILSRVERVRFYTPPKTQRSEYQKKVVADIVKASKQDLALRFKYAKKLSEEPQNLKEILDIWLNYFREVLLSTVNNQSKEYSLDKLSKLIRLIQTTSFLISTTNVNPRLAVEMLMLEL